MQVFQSVLGYMGDAPMSYPLHLVVEMIKKAFAAGEPLQTEVYVQLMKQLTGNPGEKSARKGWELLACWLQAFPPDPTIEHYVECFLRKHAPTPRGYLRLLYRSVRRGPIKEVPRDGVVNLLLTLDCAADEPQA